MTDVLSYFIRRARLFSLFLQGRATLIESFPMRLVAPLIVAKKHDEENTHLSVRGQDLFLMGDGCGFPPGVVYQDLLQFIAEIYLSRFYETKEVRLSPGDVVLDCGAHWGVYAVRSARQVGTSGRVFAFEPEQKPFDLLSRNIALNELNNATPITVALSNKPGVAEFSTSSKTGGHFVPDPELPGMFPAITTVTVPCSTIDALVFDDLGLERVDSIKMDVEGHEVAALEGALEVIRKFVPRLVICVYHHGDRDKYLIKRSVEGFSERYVMRFSPLEEKLAAWPADNVQRG